MMPLLGRSSWIALGEAAVMRVEDSKKCLLALMIFRTYFDQQVALKK